MGQEEDFSQDNLPSKELSGWHDVKESSEVKKDIDTPKDKTDAPIVTKERKDIGISTRSWMRRNVAAATSVGQKMTGSNPGRRKIDELKQKSVVLTRLNSQRERTLNQRLHLLGILIQRLKEQIAV